MCLYIKETKPPNFWQCVSFFSIDIYNLTPGEYKIGKSPTPEQMAYLFSEICVFSSLGFFVQQNWSKNDQLFNETFKLPIEWIQGSCLRAIQGKKSPCEGWLRFLIGQKWSSSSLVQIRYWMGSIHKPF
jgi:hypothetical protein